MDNSTPSPLTRDCALATGYSPRDVRRLVESGEWTRLRPGAYLPGPEPSSPEERHLLSIAATSPVIHPDAALSHGSAAVVWGIPLWRPPRAQVHVTRPGRVGSRTSRRLIVHPGTGDVAVVERAGRAVTSAARTVVDLARTLSFEEGVVAADGALRLGLVTSDDLLAEVDLAKRRSGVEKARAVMAFADGRSESVGESRSRVALHRAGLPEPELQVRVRNSAGAEIARCDFGYREWKIVAEFDGRVKYGRLLKPGETASDVVFQEKLREDALRDAGWIVVRWVWDELDRPFVIVARLRRAFERAGAWR